MPLHRESGGIGQAHHLAQRRRILPARHGRLRAQIGAAVRQAPTGQLEAGIGVQMIEIVGILVAAGDGQHPSTQDVGDAVRHQRRIVRVGDQPRQRRGDADAPLSRAQQHHAAIGADVSTIECRDHFLAANRWKTKGQDRIVGHGGCGSARSCGKDGLETQSLSPINALRDTPLSGGAKRMGSGAAGPSGSRAEPWPSLSIQHRPERAPGE